MSKRVILATELEILPPPTRLANKLFVLKNYPRRDQMVILQDLARILQKMVILQDLARRWISCKILQDEWLSCKILARRMVILQDSCVKKIERKQKFTSERRKKLTKIAAQMKTQSIFNKIEGFVSNFCK